MATQRSIQFDNISSDDLTTISIDTSFFVSNNYFESTTIKQIISFAQEGLIRVLITEITHDER
jgi:hypothetical protein